jgi:hypothetical protein
MVAGASCALLLPLLFPLLTGRIFTKDDLAALHLPFRFLYQQALQSGDFLLWTPAYHAGFFLHGAGEAALTHPLHLLLYRWLPLGVAFNLEIACTYVFMFGGAALLLRSLGLSTAAAGLGAMLTAFSGFTIYNLMHVNHIATLAHAPWLLYCCHAILTGRMRPSRGVPLATLITGSQLLSGNPQYVWITLVAVLFLCACLVDRQRWGRFGWLAAGAVLGGCIGAVQLLPAIEFYNDSTRAAFSPEQATSFSLSPLNLIQLWAPFAFEFRVAAPPGEAFIIHEFVVYNGALCTLALGWLAIRWRELTQRRLVVLFLVFGGLALWLAFGRHGGLYTLLAQLPGLRGIRAPARHIALFQFALAGLAALAFDDMLTMLRRGIRIDARRLWPLAVPVVLAVISIVVAASLSGSAWASAHDLRLSPFLRAAPWSVPLVISAGLMAAIARGRAVALPLLLAVAVLDLGAWGYSYAYRWGPLESIASLKQQAQVPPGANAGDMIPPVTGGRDYLAILRGLRLINGYTGLYPRSAVDFGTPTGERLYGLRWRGDGDRWEAVTDALPRARLLTSATVAPINTINVETTAVVEEPVALSGTPGSARVVSDRAGHIDVETTGTGRQLLVLTERFHRGWRTRIDGGPATPIAVYHDFLGQVVDGGTHRIEFEFWPESFAIGLRVAIGGLLVMAFVAVILDRIERRRLNVNQF